MRDLRRYSRQTNLRLAVGFVLILLIVGDGLIYLIYGKAAALMGLICISLGMMPIVLIFLILLLMDWIVRRANNQ